MIDRRTLFLVAALGAGGFAAGFVASQLRETESKSPEAAAIPGLAAAGPDVRSPAGEPGSQATDFRFVDQHGEEHRFTDWHGAARMVNFWGTWCPPCVHEIPMLIALQESFRADGLQIIGVAVDDSADAFAMAKELGMNYPTMADSRRSIDLLRAYGNRTGALPFTAFVDPEGVIQDRHTGALTLEQSREKLRGLLP